MIVSQRAVGHSRLWEQIERTIHGNRDPLGDRDGLKYALCMKDGAKLVAAFFPRGQQEFKAIKDKFKADSKGIKPVAFGRFRVDDLAQPAIGRYVQQQIGLALGNGQLFPTSQIV